MTLVAGVEYDTITVTPMQPTIGALVTGFRMDGDVPAEQVAEIRRALLDWKVIFFRDQDVTIEEHVAFGRLFGELEVHPFAPKEYAELPEILAIKHDASSKRGENNWHSDVTWRLEPSLGSILRCRVCPPIGGDTLFADMYAAYDGLTDEIKEAIDGKVARHSFQHNFGRAMSDDVRAKFAEQYPDPFHPVVRTHPETGRKGLYVNSSFTVEIVDMDPDESRRLLEHLYRQAAIPEYQVRFSWAVDSVAFWDNRAVQHYAAFDYLPHDRHVERATVIGDRPF
ncbi:MAG: taurine dioxygenase [Actinomycetota bacterium]